MIPIFFKVYQVSIKWPRKHDVQRVIVRYLTRQDNAFSNSDIHAERWHHDPGWIYKQHRKQSGKIKALTLSSWGMERHVELEEILSSLLQLQHCHQNFKNLQWPLRKILNATSELSHLWFYPLIPFFFSWIETLLINPPESSSSHHPNKQGEKKRLEKSAAHLNSLVKIFWKSLEIRDILFELSYFKAAFHSHTLLTIVIRKTILLFLNQMLP